MNFNAIEQIAAAVLYEGYVLYPYRASAVKNRQRWNFGGLFPRAYCEVNRDSDAWRMQTECLVELATDEPGREPLVDIKLRCLQISIREVGRVVTEPATDTPADSPSAVGSPPEPKYRVVESAIVDGRSIHTWQEAIERNVVLEALSLPQLAARPITRAFSFPPDRKLEIHRNQTAETSESSADDAGPVVIVRRQRRIDGSIEVSAEAVAEGLFRVRAVVRNATPIDDPYSATRDEAAMDAMASTHMILGCRGAQFVSLMDPPGPWSELAAECKNIGAWPVLVGTEPQRDFMLAAPIILYDYPQIAPESAGELFDGTEIDEILTLRIMSLTDEEKAEMRSLDDRTRAILERTENMPPDQLAKLHGAIRGLRALRPHELEKRTETGVV